MSTLEQLVVAAEADFIGAQDPAALENAKAKYLGKTGLITEQMKGLGKLDPDARRAQGAVINEAKEKIESLLSARRQALADAQMQTRLNAEAIDVTLPGRGRGFGGIHPVMRTWERVEAIFGSIGFDVAEYLTEPHSLTLQPEAWLKEWGIDKDFQTRGALLKDAQPEVPVRKVYLLQRKNSKVGAGLGKTTGWIHRTSLKKKGVDMLSGAHYVRIDDEGLWVEFDGQQRCLDVDHVIVCAGQEPQRELHAGLQAKGVSVHLIGGADVAAELDAKRAIRQGAELAARI
jgi:hypothetical protein